MNYIETKLDGRFIPYKEGTKNYNVIENITITAKEVGEHTFETAFTNVLGRYNEALQTMFAMYGVTGDIYEYEDRRKLYINISSLQGWKN